MAQLEQGHGVSERMRHAVRQRPWMLVACMVCIAVLVGAAWLGAGRASASGEFDILREDGLVEHGGAEPGTKASGSGDDVDGASGAQAAAAGDGADEVGASKEGSAVSEERGAPATVVVDVAGAVAAPAVVELPQNARVQDAIEAAGGLAPDADAGGVNRAARLTDGQQIYIPRVGEVAAGAATAPASGASAAAGSTGSADTSPGGGLVNINTADVAALDALPGVGPSTAQAIIEDREANGAFSSPEDLMRVTGIGEKKFEKLRASICV